VIVISLPKDVLQQLERCPSYPDRVTLGEGSFSPAQLDGTILYILPPTKIHQGSSISGKQKVYLCMTHVAVMDFGPISSTHGPSFGLSRTRWGLVAETMLPEMFFLHAASHSVLFRSFALLAGRSHKATICILFLWCQTETPSCNGWQREALRSSECNGHKAENASPSDRNLYLTRTIACLRTREFFFHETVTSLRNSRLIRILGYKRLVSNPEHELVWWMHEG
jgi:hypothetical protein